MNEETISLIVEIDPNEVVDISEAHRESLLAQGLKPYRLPSGQIKWANEATILYKMSQRVKPRLKLLPTKSQRRGRYKRKSQHAHMRSMWLMIRDNILFITIMFLLAFIVYFLYKNHLFLY